MDPNWLKYLQGAGQSFNPYSAGNKQYGTQGSPNLGPTDQPEGYAERDNAARLRRDALLRRMKANQGGRFMSAPSLNGSVGR